MAPVGRGRERIGVEMGRDITGEPRVGVLPPRSPDPIRLLVDREVGEPCFLQLDRARMPAIPAPMIANRNPRPSSTNPVPFSRFSVRNSTPLGAPDFMLTHGHRGHPPRENAHTRRSAGSTASTASASAATTTPPTRTTACCWCATTTVWPPERLSHASHRDMEIVTWVLVRPARTQGLRRQPGRALPGPRPAHERRHAASSTRR